MKILRIAIVGLWFVTSIIFGAEEAQPSLKFQNQRGSTLTIVKKSTGGNAGMISGSFVTVVASKNCQQVIGKAVPVIGFYNGNAMALTINFPACEAVVGMVGNMVKENIIQMIWLNAHQAKDPSGNDWNSRLIGYDEYRKVT